MLSTLLMTAQEMREVDQFAISELNISGSELMQRAGQGIADAVCECLQESNIEQTVLIVAGRGNNGGDGFAAARLLHQQNIDVHLLSIGVLQQLQGDTADQAEMVDKAGVVISEIEQDSVAVLPQYLEQAGLIVDALFGTGLNRPLPAYMCVVVNAMNAAAAPKLAVDIASGIHSDTGYVQTVAVHADYTLPIVSCKWGHWLADGPDHVGVMMAPVDIGIDDGVLLRMQHEYGGDIHQAELISQTSIDLAFPSRARQSYKNNFGHVWVFGGSIGYTGAPQLAALGAMSVGAGLVSLACPRDVHAIIAGSLLEVMVHPQKNALWHAADVVVAGPGWGKSQDRELLEFLMSDVSLVLDADALNMLSESKKLIDILKRRVHLTVLTPHAGEAARLLGVSSAKVQEDRLGSALALAEKYSCWVVLKGEGTLIISPDRHVWLCPFGSPNLARAGTGDVLAGMIGGILVRKVQADIAIPAAVALHGQAGESDDWYRAGQLPDRIAASLFRDIHSS